MCWSRKGVPGSKRSGEAATPFLGPDAEPNFPSERAAGWSVGWSAYRGPPNGPPQTNTSGAWDDCSTVSGGPRIIAPAPRSSIRAWQRRRGVRGTAFSPGVVGRAPLSWGSPASETPASLESSREPRGWSDEWFSSGPGVSSGSTETLAPPQGQEGLAGYVEERTRMRRVA